MRKIPRCPTCGTYLNTSRTVDEVWRVDDAGRGHWCYRLACPGCLTIARLERPEMDAAGRAPSTAPQVEVPGAHVARALERLREAGAIGSLGPATTALRESDDAWLLRVPEVLAAVREAFGARVKLVRPAYFFSSHPLTGKAVDPEGRIELREISPRALEGAPDAAHELVLRLLAEVDELAASGAIAGPGALVTDDGAALLLAGCAFSIRGTTETALLLDARDLPVYGRRIRLSGVEAFVAPADLLAPEHDAP